MLLFRTQEMEGNTQRAGHTVWGNPPHGQAEASPRSTACTEGIKGNSTCPRDLAACCFLLSAACGPWVPAFCLWSNIWSSASFENRLGSHTWPHSTHTHSPLCLPQPFIPNPADYLLSLEHKASSPASLLNTVSDSCVLSFHLGF